LIKFTKFFRVIACLTCLLITSNSNAQGWPPTGMNGSGTSSDPWQITTQRQLQQLATYVNAGNTTAGVHYILMSDIVFPLPPVVIPGAFGWTPIGNDPINGAVFQGNFNGNGKVISNIFINGSTTSYIGLFGYVDIATIRNLGIETYRINGDQYVGVLVGYADNSIIENCYTSGSVIGTSVIGGLIGMSYNSTISKCYSLCDVSGNTNIGGLVGVNSGTIQRSYAAGNVSETGTGNNIGGFVGTNNNTIIDCYATGNVNGTSYIGGFAGVNGAGSITYCYATGNITTTGSYIGGLVGNNQNGATLRNCVAANNTISGGVSNVQRVAGSFTGIMSHNHAYDGMVVTPYPSGGEPGFDKNMVTLKSFNFYNDDITIDTWYNYIPWSIDKAANTTKIWKICDGVTLPFFQWEGIVCTPVPCSFNAYGGDGSQSNPYKIYYPCQLADLATFVNSGNGSQTLNKYFKLMNDIDLIDYATGQGWEPIGVGYYFPYNNKFNGDFDGNGKIVTNLKINREMYDPVALFGSISNATIHDLGIENCDVKGGYMAGSLVGTTYLSTIQNCYATGTVVSTGDNNMQIRSYAGGLIGEIYYSTLEDSYTICDVLGASNVTGPSATGGLVGQQSQVGTISNCYASGNVIGASVVGGLVGSNYTLSIIENCVAANPSVTGNATLINRITGSIGGVGLSHNYAYDNMIISPNGGVQGSLVPMNTLLSFNFYDTGSNWYSSIPWDIDDVPNTSVIWGICDTENLPFFQWQGFNCSNKAQLYQGNNEEYTLDVGNVKSTFSIFPNPTSNSITISSESNFHTIEIVDLFGRIVHSQSNNKKNITLDVSNYCAGMYFVRIISKDVTSVLKFVKK